MTYVSVIIPAYNCQAYIKEAIESVLSQEITNLEIIVIDDGSNDETATIASSYEPRVICLSQENLGIAAARNRGIKLARGEFIAFLDADDIWTKNKLNQQLALFKTDPSIDAIFGHVVQFVSPELTKELQPVSQEPIPGYSVCTLLMRRESFLKIGLFSTDHVIGETLEWYGRLIQNRSRVVICQEVFLKRRIHKNNSGIRHKSNYRDYVSHLKKLLDDKRRKEHAHSN
jgi:glycosyltransferase involved in cell wall biosynthesis